MKSPKISPCCLTIAGSDSGGNAGIQADLRAFHAYGLHACTVLTALTAQNPSGVSAIHPVPAEFVTAQLRQVLGTYSIRALKTGMLGTDEVIRAVARALKSHTEIKLVIDPVMVATSGARLISESAIAVLASELLPLATLITPNLPEAEILCGHAASAASARGRTAKEARELARELYTRYGVAVLVKGGHGANVAAEDVLYDGQAFHAFCLPWVKNPISTHGTGCSLAAALASELARGADLVSAVRGAKNYVHRAILNSYYVGSNCGVLGFVKKRTLSQSSRR